MDLLNINIGIIRINLFAEYLAKFAEIFNDFKKIGKKIKMKALNYKKNEYDFKIEKQLYNMRIYIYFL